MPRTGRRELSGAIGKAAVHGALNFRCGWPGEQLTRKIKKGIGYFFACAEKQMQGGGYRRRKNVCPAFENRYKRARLKRG